MIHDFELLKWKPTLRDKLKSYVQIKTVRTGCRQLKRFQSLPGISRIEMRFQDQCSSLFFAGMPGFDHIPRIVTFCSLYLLTNVCGTA